MSTRVEYKVGDDILKILQESIYESYKGRVNFTGPDPQRILYVKTGIAGMKGANDAIKQMAINSGMVISASEVGMMASKTITDESTGAYYTSYTIPFLANIRFTIDPTMDTLEVPDEEVNPFLNGYKQSSYNYIITEEDELLIEIICIGKRPVFRDELMSSIVRCSIDTEYKMPAEVLMNYIMNCLKNLK